MKFRRISAWLLALVLAYILCAIIFPDKSEIQ